MVERLPVQQVAGVRFSVQSPKLSPLNVRYVCRYAWSAVRYRRRTPEKRGEVFLEHQTPSGRNQAAVGVMNLLRNVANPPATNSFDSCVV